MDSRDIPQAPSHQQLQPPPEMVMSNYRIPNAAALMGPTSTSQSIHQLYRLPFGSIASQQHQSPQTLHQQQQMDQKTLQSLGFGDGSLASSQPMPFGIEQNQNQHFQQQQVSKKRGKPGKYTSDGNIALGLAPTSPLLPASSDTHGGVGTGDSGGGGNTNSADPPPKRGRGRPRGSFKKQLDDLGATAGVGFTPHVIEVKMGEDIASKLMAFSEQGPRTISILSASGAVTNVTLHQAYRSSGTVTYEGPFEIISLSGTFLNNELNGSVNRSGSLIVCLGRPDGQILGGSVVGSLNAATEVQIIVGSYVAEAKKPKEIVRDGGNNGGEENHEPASGHPKNIGSGSQGPSSESSEGNENESDSPSMHHESNNNGIYRNYVAQQQQEQQQQALHPHQMQMYQVWRGSGQ